MMTGQEQGDLSLSRFWLVLAQVSLSTPSSWLAAPPVSLDDFLPEILHRTLKDRSSDNISVFAANNHPQDMV